MLAECSITIVPLIDVTQPATRAPGPMDDDGLVVEVNRAIDVRHFAGRLIGGHRDPVPELTDIRRCGECCTPKGDHRDEEWASGARRRQTAAGFRMPLTKPGVRLSIRTWLFLDVHA